MKNRNVRKPSPDAAAPAGIPASPEESASAAETAADEQAAPAYTYIVRCADGTYYTGWTNHLTKRIAAHNAGKGAKYTKPRRPVRLVYYEVSDTKEEAMRREWQIKQMTRAAKEKMMACGRPDGEGIPCADRRNAAFVDRTARV